MLTPSLFIELPFLVRRSSKLASEASTISRRRMEGQGGKPAAAAPSDKGASANRVRLLTFPRSDQATPAVRRCGAAGAEPSPPYAGEVHASDSHRGDKS